MREARLGALNARICGGTDREGGGDGPVVVLLHGFGAPGDDLVPLWRTVDVPREVRWVFPEAPLALPSMGYGMDSRAWWMIDMVALQRAIDMGVERDLSGSVPDGLPEARAMVLDMLDAIDRELAPSALVLGGFSQGAMLALDVALHTERAIAGLALMSGTLLAEAEWGARMPARAGTTVILSHGREDPLLSYSMTERLRERLVSAGLDVRFLEFRGGHEIPETAIAALERLVREAAG